MTKSVHSIDPDEARCLGSLVDSESVAYSARAHCAIQGASVESSSFSFKARKSGVVRIGTRWIGLPGGERVAALSFSHGDQLDEMCAFEFSPAWIKSVRVVSAAARGDAARIDAAIEITSLTNDRTYFQIADLHDQDEANLLLSDSLQLNRSEVRDLALH